MYILVLKEIELETIINSLELAHLTIDDHIKSGEFELKEIPILKLESMLAKALVNKMRLMIQQNPSP